MQVRLNDSITGTDFAYGKGAVLSENDQPEATLREWVRAGLAEPLPEARETATDKRAVAREKTDKK